MTRTNEAVNLANTIKHKLTAKKLDKALVDLTTLGSTLIKHKKLSEANFGRFKAHLEALEGMVDKLREAPKLSQDDLNSLEDRLNEHVRFAIAEIPDVEIPETDLQPIEERIEEVRKELLKRINSQGGGQANRQINVNSSVMSTRYTDINFRQAGNVGWSVSNDDVNKRVDIQASVLVGGGETPGGDNEQVQYNDNGSFGGSSTLTWNKNASVLATPIGLVNKYLELTETDHPANPTDAARIHALDSQGFTVLMVHDPDGLDHLLFREQFMIVRNTSGSTITKGQLVYITGATGQVANVALAKADSNTTMPAIGVVNIDMDDNAFGQVVILGRIESMDTSAFSEGDEVYVSATTAGDYATSPPLHPNLSQVVGIVVRSHANNGVIEVSNPFYNQQAVATNSSVFTIGQSSVNGVSLRASVTGARLLNFPDESGTITTSSTLSLYPTTSTLTGSYSTTSTIAANYANVLRTYTGHKDDSNINLAVTSLFQTVASISTGRVPTLPVNITVVGQALMFNNTDTAVTNRLRADISTDGGSSWNTGTAVLAQVGTNGDVRNMINAQYGILNTSVTGIIQGRIQGYDNSATQATAFQAPGLVINVSPA